MSQRIVGGDQVTLQEYENGLHSWLVHRNRSELCAGFVIHPEWMLTAAHCDYKVGGNLFINDYNILRDEDTQVYRTVAQVIEHPQFDVQPIAGITGGNPNDITLVKLSSRLPAGLGVARLPKDNDENNFLTAASKAVLVAIPNPRSAGKTRSPRLACKRPPPTHPRLRAFNLWVGDRSGRLR